MPLNSFNVGSDCRVVVQHPLERTGHEVDDFICTIEQAILNGQNPGPGTLYQYVTETDGSASTYQFAGVVFKFSDAAIPLLSSILPAAR